MSNRKFTLVEMLVVIAIIGIMASMLMPSLRSAMDSARSINCRSNIKKFGMATSMYYDSYNGMLQVFGSSGNSWYQNSFFLNFFNAKVSDWNPGLLCPNATAAQSLHRVEYSYGVNGSGLVSSSNGAYTTGYISPSIAGTPTGCYASARIKKPSASMLMIDAVDWWTRNTSSYDNYLVSGEASSSMTIAYRHDSGASNMLYFDYHVDSEPWINIYWTGSSSAPYATKKLWCPYEH